MSRIAAAAAFAAMIVLISDPSHARARFRMFSSSPSKPIAAVAPRAAAPAAAAPVRNGPSSVFISVGGRPAGAAPQQAVGDPGPSLYNPTPGSSEANSDAADNKAEPLKELAAAPSTECAVKEAKPAKNTLTVLEAANTEPVKTEPAKTEPPRSRSAFLVPVVNRHPLAPAPRRTTVCYVQRDGTCAP